MNRIDLTQYRLLNILFHYRWPQFLIRAIALAGLIFTILAGLFGTRVGSHNFATIFVWIAWWSALKLFFIPLGGRSWCSICPIPLPGEWLQNRGILSPRGPQTLRGRAWPKALRGHWLQVGTFLLIGLFGAIILTSPNATALILVGLFILATILSLIFERRAFCLYLCPIGGFTGLYAKLTPPKIGVKETYLCATHTEKTCYHACPWGQYPLALKSSANCGLCMECLRVCPYNNIAVNLRPWGAEMTLNSRVHLDETFLGLVMITTALVDAAIFLGPWGALKSAAYALGSPAWWLFATAFLVTAIFLIPGFYALAVSIALNLQRSTQSLPRALNHYSPILLPLGLTTWIAFTINFAFTKFTYIPSVISDPLGWGWNLLGLSTSPGPGEVPFLGSLLQIVILAIGMFWSTNIACRQGEPLRSVIPLLFFIGGVGISMMWLLVG